MTTTKIETIGGIKHYFTLIGDKLITTTYHADKSEAYRTARLMVEINDNVEMFSIGETWKVKAISSC